MPSMRIEGLILSPSRHSTTLSKLPSTCDLNATYPLSSTISVQAASARPRERKLLSHPPQFCSDLVTWQRTCCLVWDDPVGAAPTYQTDNNAFKPQFKLYKYRAGGWRGQRDGSLASRWVVACGLLVSSQYRTHFNLEIYHTVNRRSSSSTIKVI